MQNKRKGDIFLNFLGAPYLKDTIILNKYKIIYEKSALI